MPRAPGLFPALGNRVALGQNVELLIDVFYVKILLHAAAHGGLEAVLYLVLYDKRNIAEARAIGIKQRKVDYRVPLGVDGGDLL